MTSSGRLDGADGRTRGDRRGRGCRRQLAIDENGVDVLAVGGAERMALRAHALRQLVGTVTRISPVDATGPESEPSPGDGVKISALGAECCDPVESPTPISSSNRGPERRVRFGGVGEKAFSERRVDGRTHVVVFIVVGIVHVGEDVTVGSLVAALDGKSEHRLGHRLRRPRPLQGSRRPRAGRRRPCRPRLLR